MESFLIGLLMPFASAGVIFIFHHLTRKDTMIGFLFGVATVLALTNLVILTLIIRAKRDNA